MKKLKRVIFSTYSIGNLGDITLRSIEILKISDFILCEDTRVSKNLLNKFKINSKLISNHKFNEKQNLSKIIVYNEDKIISLISDAGTPGISDPGSILVNECIKKKSKCFSFARTIRCYYCSFSQWVWKNIYFMVFS